MDKLYKCTIKGCSASFSRPWRLADHVSAHSGERRFVCDEDDCDKSYTSLSHLKRHLLTAHTPHTEPSAYPCGIVGCGKVLKTRETLLKHNQRAHTPLPHVCHICEKGFHKEEQLISHSQNRHNNQLSHQCERCNMVFMKLGKYNRHMRRHRLHVCSHVGCYFTCDDYSELRRHVAFYHPKFVVFTCDDCGREMRDKAQMRRHVTRHLVVQGLADEPAQLKPNTPFPCELCSAVLTTKGSLKRHVFLIHQSCKKERRVKKGVERARRWDKGFPRRSVATLLTSVEVPMSLERELLNKSKYSSSDTSSARVLDLVLNHIKQCSDLPSPEKSHSCDISSANNLSPATIKMGKC